MFLQVSNINRLMYKQGYALDSCTVIVVTCFRDVCAEQCQCCAAHDCDVTASSQPQACGPTITETGIITLELGAVRT
jgi:hypothetical protein